LPLDNPEKLKLINQNLGTHGFERRRESIFILIEPQIAQGGRGKSGMPFRELSYS
jgi:hypothetical protein